MPGKHSIPQETTTTTPGGKFPENPNGEMGKRGAGRNFRHKQTKNPSLYAYHHYVHKLLIAATAEFNLHYASCVYCVMQQVISEC